MARLPAKGLGDIGVRRDARVSFLLKEGEELFPCPYDKSHFVLENKLITHLTKCRHNYLNANKGKEPGIVVCRHSYLHHVPVAELDGHHENCPSISRLEEEVQETQRDCERNFQAVGGDREELYKDIVEQKKLMEDQWLVSEDSLKAAKLQRPSWEHGQTPAPSPNARFTGYDPRVHVRQNQHDLVLNPQGMTQSEKAVYREKIQSGNFCEEDEELPEINPKFRKAKRDGRTPMGFPGWELEDGGRSSRQHQRRMGP